MLILTRRVGESVMIGKHITVIVLSVNGDRVQLGTTAPKELAVHREEIYEQVTANNHPSPARRRLNAPCRGTPKA